MKTVISCRAVILQGEELLVVKQGTIFCLPWWKLDHGETTEECLRREIEEELNFEVRDMSLLAIQHLIWKELDLFDFFYLIHNSEDFDLDEISDASHSYELETVRWIDIHDPEIEVLPYDIMEILQEWNLDTVYKFTNTIDD